MPSLDIRIRGATAADCAVILHHRRRMFEDMKEGSAQDLDRMVEATAPWLQKALADGSYRGWLAEDAQGRVVGGGGVLVSSWPAGPRDPCTLRAVIINVYVEPEFRRRGLARRLMLLMIQWLREQGFRSVALHASASGRPLYQTLGFLPTNEMRLDLSEQPDSGDMSFTLK
jgi:GNAT superfamily N-acetyltransferase